MWDADILPNQSLHAFALSMDGDEWQKRPHARLEQMTTLITDSRPEHPPQLQ